MVTVLLWKSELASDENLPLCWQLQVNTKLIYFSIFFFVLFWNQRGKVKIYLLLSGHLEITAVTWAGFTIILVLLELLLGDSSTQRESNLPSVYLLTCPGREIMYSISKVGDFSFIDCFVLWELNTSSHENKTKFSLLCLRGGEV